MQFCITECMLWGGLSVKRVSELCCACLHVSFHVYVFPALCPCVDRNYVPLIAAQFGLVQFYMYGTALLATFLLITVLRFNTLFPLSGYDDVSEANLRSYSVHSAKHVQENRPVPIRRKRSIGKKQAVCTRGGRTEGCFWSAKQGVSLEEWDVHKKEKKAISSFCFSVCTKWAAAWESVLWRLAVADRRAQILYIHFPVAACYKARPWLENAVIFNV